MGIADDAMEEFEKKNRVDSYSAPLDVNSLLLRTVDKYSEPPIKVGFATMDRMACPLLPGSMLVLAGSPGSRKSILSLKMHIEAIKAGNRSAYLPLEMTRDEHARRIAAIHSGSWAPTDKEDHTRAISSLEQNSEALSMYSAGIWETPYQDHDDPTPQYVLDWIQARADSGCRLIIIDPFTMISWPHSREQHSLEHRFVCDARSIADSSKSTVCIVAHTTKGGENVQGTATLTRIADCVLMMGMFSDYCQILRSGGARGEEFVDMVIYIDKSRYGSGVGASIAYQFGKEGPTFKEIGIAEIKRKNGRR